MKNIYFSSLAVLLLGALMPVEAQTHSDIVGVVRNSVAANSDLPVAPCLSRERDDFGKISAINTTTGVVTVERNPNWTVDQFKDTHYVRVTGGARTGYWAQITANSANTLTLRADGALSIASGFAVGDTLDIIPHWTLGTWTAASTIPHKTTVFIFDADQAGENYSANRVAIYFTGTGWEGNTGIMNDFIITPNMTMNFDSSGINTAFDFVQSGWVNEHGHTIKLKNYILGSSQHVRVGTGAPVPVSLGELFPAPVSGSASGDAIFTFKNLAGQTNSSASHVYLWFNLSGWEGNAGVANSVTIDPGAAFIYARADTNSDTDRMVRHSVQIAN